MSPRWIPALLVGAGCGGGAPAGDPDAAPAVDAAAPDAASCETASGCAWIEAYEREIVARLTGELEIAPGVRLAARASIEERAIARQFLVDELERLGYAPALHDYGTGASVIARREAGADAPWVILGAHFDGVPAGPAAADDATGVALVLTAARWFAARPAPDRPIVFALFDQEEGGLIGSTLWADTLVADEVAVDSVHVFDMISFDGDGDGAVELWSPAPAVEALYRLHAEPLGIPVQPVAFENSDHQPFVERGLPTTGVCEEFVGGDHTPHYHQATDTYDKIDFAYLGSITALALAVVDDAAHD